MGVTIKDIARKAGVSIGTVSLALKGDSRIADRTADRIRKAAAELNYIPNNFGRALQGGKSGVIGYLSCNVTSSFFNELMQGAGEAAADAGHGLLTGITGGDPAKTASYIKMFSEKRVDGVVIAGGAAPGVMDQIRQSGIPSVICSCVSPDPAVSNIVTDDFLGGVTAGKHFIALGHKRTAWFYPFGHQECLRYKGLRSAAMKKGLPEPVFCASNEELIKVFRSKEDRPTALAAYSDKIAIEAKYLLRNIGLSIPEDVSLLGYDDIWACEIPDISLTSIAPRKIDIGAGAVKMLLRVMAGGQPESILVKPELHKRNSTAKPPGVK